LVYITGTSLKKLKKKELFRLLPLFGYQEEEEEEDEEMDGGTDYANNYFDNGEEEDDDNDNLDEGGSY
jgi:hypothetical protein